MMCLYLLSYSIELRVGEPLEPGDLLSLGRLLLLLGRGARLPRTEVKDGSKDQANSYDAQCSALCAHVCMYMCYVCMYVCIYSIYVCVCVCMCLRLVQHFSPKHMYIC